jgi:glycosyltransferase involved in cell wall biosynthesis
MHRVGAPIAVIIPVHNEAPTIDAVVASVLAHADGADVVVVDDGSTDETAERALAAGARVIRLGQNRGKGYAIREAVRETPSDVLVFIDGDGQDDPAEIPAMLAALTPDVDLVLGSRFVGTFDRGAITALNLLGTRAINLAGHLMFGRGITDPCAGFRAVRRASFESVSVKANGYDIEVDVVFRILRAGGRVVEVPAVRSARAAGESGLSSFRDGLRILRRMVSVRVERIPRSLGAPATRPGR